jgi:hypothetical protein
MECITKSNEKLEIMIDESCESPREWDNLTVIVTIKNNHHTIGDIQVNSSEELRELLEDKKAEFAMPLYVYEHSGISLKCFEDKTMVGYPYNDQWDAGCIGMVFTTEALLKEAGLFNSTKKEIIEYMKAEVDTYSQWCNGECYGFRLSKWSKCDKCNQVEDKEIDSCFGYYGYDHDKNGLYDAVLENSKVFKTYKDIEELLS